MNKRKRNAVLKHRHKRQKMDAKRKAEKAQKAPAKATK